MLNKKSILNISLATALVFCVVSCFTFLMEGINLSQLVGNKVDGIYSFDISGCTLWIAFYWTAFSLSLISLVFVVLRFFIHKKWLNILSDVLVGVTIVTLFVFVCIFYNDKWWREYYSYWVIEPENYMLGYTFKGQTITAVASFAVVFVCLMTNDFYKVKNCEAKVDEIKPEEKTLQIKKFSDTEEVDKE